MPSFLPLFPALGHYRGHETVPQLTVDITVERRRLGSACLLVRLMESANVLDELTFLLNHSLPMKRDSTKASVSDSEN